MLQLPGVDVGLVFTEGGWDGRGGGLAHTVSFRALPSSSVSSRMAVQLQQAQDKSVYSKHPCLQQAHKQHSHNRHMTDPCLQQAHKQQPQ